MRNLYISYFMVTSISFSSAMYETGTIAILRAKLNASSKEIRELQKKLGMDIPLHEATTRIVGFGPTQKEINNSVVPANSNEGCQLPTAPAAHQPRASLHAYPDRNIQIAITKAPRTILQTLKKVTRRGNLATLNPQNSTPIAAAPATTVLRAEKLPQRSQPKSHSGTSPIQLCYSCEETDVKNSSAIPVESSQDTSGHVEPIRGFVLAGTIATQEKPVLLDPQCFLYLCKK